MAPGVIKGAGKAMGRLASGRAASSVGGAGRSANQELGNLFNRTQRYRYPHNEVYVQNPTGGYTILDSYNPSAGEIVSRKFTQFSQIKPQAGVSYVNEVARKYKPGSVIADVPSSGGLAGQTLRGQMILEVPIQTRPVPQAVLDAAVKRDVVIRDVLGKVY